jgi:hypothetical protein
MLKILLQTKKGNASRNYREKGEIMSIERINFEEISLRR